MEGAREREREGEREREVAEQTRRIMNAHGSKCVPFRRLAHEI